MAFRATLKKLPDSQVRLFDGLVLNTRVVAKVMSIFKSQGVFQRDVEMERGQARDVASRVKPRNDAKLTRSGPNRLEGKRTQRAAGPQASSRQAREPQARGGSQARDGQKGAKFSGLQLLQTKSEAKRSASKGGSGSSPRKALGYKNGSGKPTNNDLNNSGESARSREGAEAADSEGNLRRRLADVRDKLTARGLDAPSAEYIPTYPGVASTTLVKVEGPDFYGVFVKYL
jgi:hypothetical protein